MQLGLLLQALVKQAPMTLHLRLAAALQLLHWAAIKLGSRSRGLQPWALMLASTLLWACTKRGCSAADQSWWQLEHWADTWMLPDLPCWLPEATASDAKASSLVAGHLLHTICKTTPLAYSFVCSCSHRQVLWEQIGPTDLSNCNNCYLASSI